MSEWSHGSVIVQPLADHGLLCTFGNRIEADLGRRIARLTDALADAMPPGVVDLIPSYSTLLLLLDPAVADQVKIGAQVVRLWDRVRADDDGDDGGATRPEVVIPVHYGGDAGPDLASVARHTGLAPGEVTARHAAATYQVGAIGFAPGFAFLIGLPSELAVPRRLTPRTAVPAGSVGIGGAQTGIYSLTTPGGWSLIGRTTLTLFDPERDPPSLLQTGDTVRFQPVTSPAATVRLARPTIRPHPPHFHDTIEVIRPGLQDTVQDSGRPGHGRLGVAPGGAADRAALVAGNRLLGNADDAAGLEITRRGPHLRFLRPARIVVTGADLGARLDDMPLPVGAVRVVRPGSELAFGESRGHGARAYLGVAGGIDVPLRLGSRSTDLTARFGGHVGRPLQGGDRLRTGRPGPSPVRTDAWQATDPGDRPIRVTPGPQAERFDERAWAIFLESRFTVSAQANRMGVRLEGPALVPTGGADIISEGIVTGAMQVTGEGQPIVMLPARATIGGYPKIATVIAADLDRLGQLKPGDDVRFALVEGAAAKR